MQTPPIPSVRLGTRGSALARWQTDHVADLLRVAWPGLEVQVQIIATHGDRALDMPLPLIGGKGLFTAELETALRSGDIDLAVHSLKDLPTQTPADLLIGATPPRENPADVLVSRVGYTLETLPGGAAVGTSSRRRAAQLLRHRPDLRVIDVRGNVDTRLRKALDPDGLYDAVILACAGVARLGCLDVVSQEIPLDVMLPAPGQGALAVQCRDEAAARALLAPINDPETEIAIAAERAFLAGLGGGCSLPVAAYAVVEGGQLRLRGRVAAPDGSAQIDVSAAGAVDAADAQRAGAELAQVALGQGAAAILEAMP